MVFFCSNAIKGDAFYLHIINTASAQRVLAMTWPGWSASLTQLLLWRASVKGPWIGLWYPGNASNRNVISKPAMPACLPSTWVTDKKIFQGSARGCTAVICKLHKQDARSQKIAWFFLILWNMKQSAVLHFGKRLCSKEISVQWQKAVLSRPVYEELPSPSWVVRDSLKWN